MCESAIGGKEINIFYTAGIAKGLCSSSSVLVAHAHCVIVGQQGPSGMSSLIFPVAHAPCVIVGQRGLLCGSSLV